MSESVGQLMDKLSIVNLKLWFCLEDFKSTDQAVVFRAVQKHNVLNVERGCLIREIDALLGQTNRDVAKTYEVT
jgi:hypothetical protein